MAKSAHQSSILANFLCNLLLICFLEYFIVQVQSTLPNVVKIGMWENY